MNNVEKFEEGEVHYLTPDQQLEDNVDAVISGNFNGESENVKRLHPQEETKDKIDQIETELANENLSDEEKQSLLEKKEFYQQLLNKIAV